MGPYESPPEAEVGPPQGTTERREPVAVTRRGTPIDVSFRFGSVRNTGYISSAAAVYSGPS